MSGTTLNQSESVFEIDDELEPMEELIEDELAEEQDDPVAEFVASDSSRVSMDATQLYLGEIGFSPLLTAEEEVFFASAQ